MALITYAIPGVTLASGRTAYGSSETVAWLPVFIRWAKVVHGVDVVVIQAAGGATASAGTHTDGCAIDIRSWNIPADKIAAILLGAREAGGWAWLRTKAQGFDPHIHIALDCDRYTASSYQVAAAKAGYNGLGSGGRGGRDDGPRPSTFRIWSAGVRWLQADIDPHLQEDDMTPEQSAKLDAVYAAVADRAGIERAGESAARQTVNYPVLRAGAKVPMIQEIADAKTGIIALNGQIAGLLEAVRSLAEGQGVDLAAVEAAAERGASRALDGATITLNI